MKIESLDKEYLDNYMNDLAEQENNRKTRYRKKKNQAKESFKFEDFLSEADKEKMRKIVK